MNVYLQYLIPVISVAISFFLGQWSKSYDYKRQTARERYDKLYVPLISKMVTLWPQTQDFSWMPIDKLDDIFELLSSNLHLFGSKSARYFITYQEAYLILKEARKGNEAFYSPRAFSEFNDVFQNILLLLFQESQTIARLIKLPPLAKSISYEAYLNHQKSPSILDRLKSKER